MAPWDPHYQANAEWKQNQKKLINYIKNVSKFLHDDPQKPRVSRP
jgi:hypothetical protein